jgi:hypothetical protein
MAHKPKTNTPAPNNTKPLAPKLANDEVMLGALLEKINEARSPVIEARKMDDPVLSFADVRASLREAYLMLNGEQSDLTHNTQLGNRRRLPYLLVNYGAQHLQKLALHVLTEGESPELALDLLERSRELTAIIERHLFGQTPPKDSNVVDFRARNATPRKRR